MILSLYVSAKKPLLCIASEKPNKALGVRCVNLRCTGIKKLGAKRWPLSMSHLGCLTILWIGYGLFQATFT